MTTARAVGPSITAFVAILLTTLAMSYTRAEVRTLTIGIDTNCPYGLSE